MNRRQESRSSVVSVTLIATVLLLAAASAIAQQPGGGEAPAATHETEDPDAWTFRLTPYFWMTNLSVSGQIRGNRFSGTMNFSEICSNLDMAILLAGEARQGNWSLTVNGDFLRLSEDVRGPQGGKATLTLDGVIVDGTGGYRFAELDLGRIGGGESASTLAFEALAGVRYYYNELKVNPENAGSESRDLDWLDLVAGARAIWDVTERLHLGVRADFGGFNIDGSQLSFQTLAAIEYDISKSVSLNAGYRYLSMGYEPQGASDTDLRMRMKGMLVGVTFRF